MIHGDLLGERARLTPGKLAVVDVASGARLSYGQLDTRATACARVLRQVLGFAKGDRVGLLAGNCVEYLDFVYAAGKSGLVLVPMGTRLTAHELEHVVRDSGMRALIYDGGFVETVRALRDLVDLEGWIAIDDDGAQEGDDRLGGLLRAVPATPWARERCGPEDLYALLYTSGTTGRPKGVMVPHRMMSWNAYNTVACWQLREDDVSPIFTPLYHAGALGAFLLPMVAIGGTVVLHAGFNTAEVWQTIGRERCTVVLGVPTIWKMLLEAPEFETADVAHVRWFISGGAPLPEYIAEAFQARGIVFKQGYGLTEVGVNCFSMTVEESVRKRGSIGKPLMMTEARLIDATGGEVEVGEVGELCLRGPHVSRGYWNDEEATAAALDAEGWFHTGDLARRDEEGFHYIAGRRKDMFISGGVNVYPAEIEAELLQHADVADAAVVSVPHATWGEVGVAFVAARSGRSVDAGELTRHLAGRLARYKLPKDFVAVDALPRTAYGKVQKGLLRDEYVERHPVDPLGERTAPRDVKPVVLAHAVAGSGPPLLLLNGGLMSLRAWDAVAERLTPRFTVVRCDFRGQLLSPGLPPDSLQGHAGDVVRLLDHLGIGTAHVAGTSFGALVGLTLAAAAPARVRSLVAITATDRVTSEMWTGARALAEAFAAAAEGGDGGLAFDLVAKGTFSPAYRHHHAAELTARRRVVASLPPTWFDGVAGLLRALRGLDLGPLLPLITCPTLVLGAGGDETFPVRHSRSLAAGLPNARLQVIADAAHGIVSEAPGVVAGSILEFLDRIGDGPGRD